jgi:hypothetical protein
MRAFLLTLALLFSTTACTAIVSGEPGPLRCESDMGVDFCPSGQRCIEGECVACVARPEQCNGLDDDCDGVADNGLDADVDEDGVPRCMDGTIRDCDDTNPLVFPGNPEVCNGRDDDCDLGTVETDSCPAGRFCGVPVRGGGVRCLDPGSCDDVGGCDPGEICRNGDCVVDVMTCLTMPSLCGPEQVCDSLTGQCLDVGLDGMPCTFDEECRSGRCYQRSALGLNGDGGICSRACCTDANCADDQYCAATGSGARGCVPGTRRPPATCGRSGDCPSGECRHGSTTYVCGADEGGSAGGRICLGPSDCASGLCTCDGFLCTGYCLDACGSALDCPSPPFWAVDEVACVYASYGGWVSVCAYSDDEAEFGDLSNGAPCTSPDQCRDGYCVPGTDRYCADTCCNDSQCAMNEHCAPVNNGGWEMRCMRQPPAAG